MNKLRLPAFLLLSALFAFIIQGCNKDAITATAYTSKAFQANINGSTWAPDTVSMIITYNPDTKVKTLSCVGTKSQKQVIFSVALAGAGDTPGFTTGTYSVDGTSVTAQYNTQQLSNGSYVFLPHGTIEPGAGAVVVTAVDSVKKQITGTFNFYSRSTIYDGDGNVVSITVDNITSGEFTNKSYQYANNQ
ncbi:DUF6252 family protein [Mucilaginibacter ginsenosidivorans]|uniref:Lipocalin-like domain-containing protein n=1 Tax=Mucilaginibacter ginsenosidivorans TaxID=398053 RepID=A0A5B8UYS1_9SPHI|nr:DUF6252 family protein [Mucilaginibacter ginsenosidivorans]QEC63511.1 hypothetical protein FRZ54_13290 [Mucilaginibacter ginsenosidivorans]